MADNSSNRIQATTDKEIMPFIVDTVLESNTVLGRYLREAKRWRGRTMEIPFKFEKDTQGGGFSGLDTLDTGVTDNFRKLEFNPSWYYKPVTIAMDEASLNGVSETQAIDLLAAKVQSTAQDAADDLGTQFYGSNASTTKNFQGLADMVDDGSTVSTYGGQSRTTYTGLQSTVTAASSNKITLAQLDTLQTAVSAGGIQPSVNYTTPTVANLYEQLLRPQERVYKDTSKTKSLSLGTGAKSLTYRGNDILADDKCTTGIWVMLNEKDLDFYALGVHPMFKTKAVAYKSVIQGNEYSDIEGLGFSYTPWRFPANQAGATMQMFLGGQFIHKNPKRAGKLTGITSN